MPKPKTLKQRQEDLVSFFANGPTMSFVNSEIRKEKPTMFMTKEDQIFNIYRVPGLTEQPLSKDVGKLLGHNHFLAGANDVAYIAQRYVELCDMIDSMTPDQLEVMNVSKNMIILHNNREQIQTEILDTSRKVTQMLNDGAFTVTMAYSGSPTFVIRKVENGDLFDYLIYRIPDYVKFPLIFQKPEDIMAELKDEWVIYALPGLLEASAIFATQVIENRLIAQHMQKTENKPAKQVQLRNWVLAEVDKYRGDESVEDFIEQAIMKQIRGA